MFSLHRSWLNAAKTDGNKALVVDGMEGGGLDSRHATR